MFSGLQTSRRAISNFSQGSKNSLDTAVYKRCRLFIHKYKHRTSDLTNIHCVHWKARHDVSTPKKSRRDLEQCSKDPGGLAQASWMYQGTTKHKGVSD